MTMNTKDKYPDSVLAFFRMLLQEPTEITDYPVRYVIPPSGFEFCGPKQEHRSAFLTRKWEFSLSAH
jgi:hypothetical protein